MLLSPCRSILFSFRCSKQAEKNYSGLRRPVSDRLWLLRRHATHAHLDAWRKDKQLREITLDIAEIFRTCLFRFLQFLEKFTLQTNKHGNVRTCISFILWFWFRGFPTTPVRLLLVVARIFLARIPSPPASRKPYSTWCQDTANLKNKNSRHTRTKKGENLLKAKNHYLLQSIKHDYHTKLLSVM